MKQESDSKESWIKDSSKNNGDKTEVEKSNISSSKRENKKETNKDLSTDCFDFDNEEILDKEETDYKAGKKTKKQFTKGFKCDLCEKKYTWYTGLSNHKRFVHNNKTKEA